VLGLGSAVELSALDASFRLATRALETAMAFGIPGVADVDQLSLRPAILSEDHLGDTLVRRYLEPLRALGEFGETLELTVRQYLESGLRIDESARELIVHPNTMRHRLQRFQQLTGADLRKVDDLVEVWWALQRRGVSQTQGSR
jgi:DNA-binding PucR family transcriptional regulator